MFVNKNQADPTIRLGAFNHLLELHAPVLILKAGLSFFVELKNLNVIVFGVAFDARPLGGD
ncbi:MAG: hypothetical protein M1133_02380 [Armatimonadetes bacterium]|nr:hypothetical protein [Armatimonadota bacterium]